MATAVTVGALLLAAVLVAAGVGKLLDLEGSRRAVAAFGVPSSIAGGLGTLLPVLELVAAAALVAGVASVVPIEVGALSALILLAAFSVAIAASLARGRAPDCHCFGKLHSAPIGPWTLARNSALLVVAAFVASGGAPVGSAAAGAAALGLLAAVILRPRGVPAQAEGLPTGAPAPDFELVDTDGRPRTLAALRASGLPVLLVFTDPTCGPCIALAPEVARWQRDHAEELLVAVIERDHDDREGFDDHGRRNLLFQRGTEVADLYGAEGTPTAVLIGRDGDVASPVAAGGAQIEALVVQSVRGVLPRPAVARTARGLRRRELLVRATGAWAAASAVLVRPARAVAALVPGARIAAEPCEDSFDCPEHVFMHCRDGRCRCDEGFTRCDPQEATDRKCFDLQRHKDHCGSCNHQCTGADHDVCCEGECGEFGQTRCDCAGEACPGEHDVCAEDPGAPGSFFCFPCADFGWKRCGNECVDPAANRCCGGRVFSKAKLGPGDWRCCGPARARRLVNVREHERNCGACGRQCAKDEFCFEGRCRTKCPRGLKRCGDTCGSPRTHRCCKGKLVAKSDPKNCGGCGVECKGPFDTGECCAGKCCDINASTCCPGGCKNLSLDDKNCGACGNVCGPNSYCRFGVCTCPVEPCP
jgi:thiol-disulfide isomerase/thioredoxin